MANKQQWEHTRNNPKNKTNKNGGQKTQWQQTENNKHFVNIKKVENKQWEQKREQTKLKQKQEGGRKTMGTIRKKNIREMKAAKKQWEHT